MKKLLVMPLLFFLANNIWADDELPLCPKNKEEIWTNCYGVSTIGEKHEGTLKNIYDGWWENSRICLSIVHI